MSIRGVVHGLLLFMLVAVAAPARAEDDAATLIKRAIDYWRDVSSYAEFDMTIHRPDWQRSLRMKVWTRGTKESLVQVIAPAKDAGNATLLLDNDMWSYNPRINRVIRIPSSMMGQSWMGSDFSNNDLARADDLIDQYRHRLLKKEQRDGHTIYVIESVPHESAPVVWGREVVTVRDDYLLLEHAFYDQQGVLVKRMVSLEIRELGGKLVVTRERMQKMDKPQEWTEIVTRDARFGIDLPADMFTLGNLRRVR